MLGGLNKFEHPKVKGRRSKGEGRRSKVKGQRSKVEGQRAKDEGRKTKVYNPLLTSPYKGAGTRN